MERSILGSRWLCWVGWLARKMAEDGGGDEGMMTRGVPVVESVDVVSSAQKLCSLASS